MTPQLIFLGLLVLNIGISLAKHGDPQPKYSFWSTFVSTLITVGLLYWGGFFNCFI